ncbi:MAG: SGNH/GDSL hydrolase family protein [Nitrospirae bacterium]|nr:SGNH/GDSL hydrolase family protein [Nitrospirota bacterium]
MALWLMTDKIKVQPQRLLTVLTMFVSVVIAVLLGEGFLRLFFEDRLIIQEEERAVLYRYDHKLGWFPREKSTYTFTGSKPISIVHNSRGFRDIEHQKNSNKRGLLFLGDSFLWGYDVEASERFTEKLRPRLPDWNIYNLGVSGYSTDQELLLIMDQFDFYRPEIVFLVYCSDNDETDNSSNSIGSGAYYKPFYEMDERGMELRGVPVPVSLTYFARQHPTLARSYIVRLLIKAFSPAPVHVPNPTSALIRTLNEFVAQKGSLLLVGLIQPHEELEGVMRRAGIPYMQLDGAERYPANGLHWTPAGHTAVSDAIYGFLKKEGFLPPAGTD